MSQFFGCIALNKTIDVQEVAEKMQQNMSFFKGDGTGIYQTESVFICNKLLHNTPESINTPLICQNERYVLAATCRLDNREELATKLSLNDPIKASDHEYLLAAYSQFQETCVEHLLGDFSFVIWDKQDEKLFMAKDHLGIKPLFYTHQKESLFFSTDINAFLDNSAITTSFSQAYFASALFRYDYIPMNVSLASTCYNSIYRLIPAHYLLFQGGNLITKQYWELRQKRRIEYHSEEEYYEHFFKLFQESVSCRMRTNTSVGIELSGGLDSSSIACMAHHISKNSTFSLDKLFSFSLVHPDPDSDADLSNEEPFQEIVLKWIKIKRDNVIKISQHPFNSFFKEWDYGFDVHGGYSKINFTWQKPIYEAMEKQQCSIKLSGFAGDEFVTNNGRLWFYDGLAKFDLSLMWRLVCRGSVRNLRAIVGYYLNRFTGFERHKKPYLNTNYLKETSRNLLLMNASKLSLKSFKKNIISCITRPYTALRCETESLHALRHGVECRYPMTDIRLLEFILSIPYHLFEPKANSRFFFRKSVEKILPNEIFTRNDKAGAVLPYLRIKNALFIEELQALELHKVTKQTSLIDNDKVLAQISNAHQLKREAEVTSLLSVIYMQTKLNV